MENISQNLDDHRFGGQLWDFRWMNLGLHLQMQIYLS
jgi:hypothetical protein